EPRGCADRGWRGTGDWVVAGAAGSIAELETGAGRPGAYRLQPGNPIAGDSVQPRSVQGRYSRGRQSSLHGGSGEREDRGAAYCRFVLRAGRQGLRELPGELEAVPGGTGTENDRMGAQDGAVQRPTGHGVS